MKITRTEIPEIVIIEPDVYSDERGFFYESYNREKLHNEAGITHEFVQDNHSFSRKNVIRGLHYQIMHPQGKLIRVTRGEIYDIAVDIRKSSPSFGKSVGVTLSEDNKKQLWIPEGFAHGFITKTDSAEVLYKTTEYYFRQHERCIRWDDADLSIDWEYDGVPILSDKDIQGVSFKDADVFE